MGTCTAGGRRRRTAALALGVLAACSASTPTRTIQGRVVNGSGAGLASLHVQATTPAGWSAAVWTAADGSFSISGVPPTYDLAVTYPGSALILQGLTRPDPTVPWGFGASWVEQRPTAVVNGDVAGLCGDLCTPAGQGVALLGGFSAADESPMATWSNALPGGIGSDVPVLGGAPVTGRLHALAWTCDLSCGPESPPLAFWHARSEPTSVVAGDVRTVAMPTLAPVATASLAVELVKPPGLPAGDAIVYVSPWFGPGSLTHVVWDRGVPTGVSAFPVPDVAELELSVSAWAPGGPGQADGRVAEEHLPAGTTAVRLQLRPPPLLTSPPEGGSAGAGSTFAWSQDAGVSALQVGAGPGDTFLTVLTARREVAWPDLAPVWQPGWVPGAALTWRVVASGAATTVDEVAAPPVGGRRSSWSTTSAERGFTLR